MQAVIDIKFDELLRIVKNLPDDKLIELKLEIEKRSTLESDRHNFENFLLNGPTFSKEQLSNLTKTRKAINQWRTK